MYVCMYVCMYVRTYVRMYVCMYVCTYAHTHIHTYIYIYIYICKLVQDHMTFVYQRLYPNYIYIYNYMGYDSFTSQPFSRWLRPLLPPSLSSQTRASHAEGVARQRLPGAFDGSHGPRWTNGRWNWTRWFLIQKYPKWPRKDRKHRKFKSIFFQMDIGLNKSCLDWWVFW